MKIKPIIEDDPKLKNPYVSFENKYLLNRQTAFNKEILSTARECGCFHCGARFNPSEITEWMYEENEIDTALCPYCEVDALIVGTEELKLSTALLSKLHEEWFKAELEERIKKATYLPFARSEAEYLQKGIVFRYENNPAIKVVGEMGLCSSSLFEVSEDQYVSGMVALNAHVGIHNELYVKYFDKENKRLFIKRSAGDSSKLIELFRKYKNNLKGLKKTPYSNTMQLAVVDDERDFDE